MIPESLSFGTIDSQDFASVLGLVVSAGTDTFKKPHEPKENYSYEWADQDGIEFDLESPIFLKARAFRLDCWLLGSSVVDFESKFSALFDREDGIFYQPGAKAIFVKRYGITVYVKLKSIPAFSIPKGVYYAGSDYVGAEISLEFDEIMNYTP